MKNLKRFLAIILTVMTMCTFCTVIMVSANGTSTETNPNLIANGNFNIAATTQVGPTGWTPGRLGAVFVESVDKVSTGTAYIYHATGGVNNSPYVEIDALTYKSKEGDPKIQASTSTGSSWIPLESDTWYNLSFYQKKVSGSVIWSIKPTITFTFAGAVSGKNVTAAVKPGDNVLYKNYESEKWVKYEFRFKTPTWVTQTMLAFSSEYQSNVSFDEISLTKDASDVEFFGGTPYGLSGDAVTAWPNKTGGVKYTRSDAVEETLEVAVLSARTVLNTRPEDGKIRVCYFDYAGTRTTNASGITAVYEKNGDDLILKACYVDTITRAEEINRLEKEISLSEKTGNQTYVVKSFVWNSISGLETSGAENSFTY